MSIEQSKKIAKAIESAYVSHLKKRGKEMEEINPIDKMSNNTGIELAYLLSEDKLQCDPTTDWKTEIYYFASFSKQLLMLIGKPGVLKKLHPTYQKEASERLLRLCDFFESLYNDGSMHDWLTWMMLKQFPSENEDVDEEGILKCLSVND